ncbi:MAG: histidine phosphatase family protein [Butyricicoccus sp.]
MRHAEAEATYRRCHGQYNALLTTRAYKQLPYLAKRFENVPLAAVYSSDLFRARVTAQAVAEPHHLSVETRPVLREIDMGDWEDIPWAELPHTWPEQYALWCARPWEAAPPHGETVMQAGQRMLDGVRAIVRENEGKEVAVVTHGSAIRGMLTIAHGFAPEQMGEIGWGDNTCVAKLEFDENGNIDVVYENDASHLPQEYSTLRPLAGRIPRAFRRRRRSGSAALTQRIHRMWIKLWDSCASCTRMPTARMQTSIRMRSSAM